MERKVDKIYGPFQSGSAAWQVSIKLKCIRKATGYKILGSWFNEPFQRIIDSIDHLSAEQRHRLYRELDTLGKLTKAGEINDIEDVKAIISELSTLDFLTDVAERS